MSAPYLPNEPEPPSEPPYLNATASWYSGDAWFLFANMIESCGYPTAKFIFEKCIKEGAEIEAANAKRKARAQHRATAAPLTIPTIAEIKTFDRKQICNWWERLRNTEQKFGSASDKQSIAFIQARYFEFGGYPEGYTEGKLPPIKKEGSVKRDAPNADLPAMFDETNPESDFSIWRAKRNGRGTKEQFAESLASRPDKKYGPTAEAVLRNERNWRKKKRKV